MITIAGRSFSDGPDIRNSKVEDIIRRLEEYGIKPVVVDPYASPAEAEQEYGVHLYTLEEAKEADCVIAAVAHDCFRALSLDAVSEMFRPVPMAEKVLIDVKGIYSVRELKKYGFAYWRL